MTATTGKAEAPQPVDPSEEAAVGTDENPVGAPPAPDTDETAAQIATLTEELARARADLHNLQTEYGNYVRRAKADAAAHRYTGAAEVIEALLAVLDDIELARTHGDLDDGPLAAIAVKLEQVLATRFDLERFGAEGEEFDPSRHDALSAVPMPGQPENSIVAVAQPGYRLGERVLRAARVIVVAPNG